MATKNHLLTFGFKGLGIKKEYVGGVHYMTNVNFLFGRITIPSEKMQKNLSDAMFNLTNREQWLIENSDAIKAAEKQVWEHRKEQDGKTIENLQRQLSELRERNNELYSENHKLRETISTFNMVKGEA